MEPTKYIWFDGEMVPWADANVHVLSHALHYGTGVFEGIRAYETPDGTEVFRLTEHMARLRHSAKAYNMNLEWSVEELVDAAKETLRVNGLESGDHHRWGLGADRDLLGQEAVEAVDAAEEQLS